MSREKTDFDLLAEYVIKSADLDPEEVMFIRLEGSAAEGSDRKYSDYDLAVVCKSENRRGAGKFWGVMNDRQVNFWVLSLGEYEDFYCKVIENEFVWQIHSAKAARAIFGEQETFDYLTDRLRTKKWTESIRSKAITFHYGNVVEYLGKMLNTYASEEEEHAFFFYAAQLADQYAQFLAALNCLDISSDNTLHSQVFDAEFKPDNFRKEFLTLSGYCESVRSKTSTLSSARILVRWARNFLIDEYGLNKFQDKGFREMVSELSYQHSETSSLT